MTQSFSPKGLVLYADDDLDDILLVTETFEPYKQRVDLKTFGDGEKLLAYIDSLSFESPMPCLIILDINMPRLSGKEVLLKLRKLQRFEHTPVVLFSTSTLPSEAAFAKAFNASFITKPLDNQQMESVIEQFIDNCHSEVRRNIRHDKQNK